MEENRYKIFSIPKSYIFDLTGNIFNKIGNMIEERIQDTGFRVVDIHENYDRQTIDFVVYSETFPICAEDALIERTYLKIR